MGQNVGALQWKLEMEGRVLEALAPTSQLPNKTFWTDSGVLFTAKRNKTTLQLSFIATPAAEMIQAVCSEFPKNFREHCDIILPGK